MIAWFVICAVILWVSFCIGSMYVHKFNCNWEFTVWFNWGIAKWVCIHLPMIQSVDKSWYNTVADYSRYKRIFSPFELDMLCK